jgi:hypothetical protein
MKKKYNESETVVIDRYKIKFAAYNPRTEAPEVVAELKRNFKRVGFLGGIVWNEITGNLISGHKRMSGLDVINGYTGTKETSYKVKVEKVKLDLKTEKEQNIFMNSADVQAKFDNFKLADLLDEIDISNTGLNSETLEMISFEVPDFNYGDNTEAKEDFKKLSDKGLSEEELKEARRKTREARQDIQNKKINEFHKPYLIVTFKNIEEKIYVCEVLGIHPEENKVSGITAFKDIL